MPELSKTWLDASTLRVMTYKSGSFTFQLGLNIGLLQPMLDRVNDAQNRFNKMPMLPQVIDQMQDKVMASSIYSTNTIEGGQFTEQETEYILKQDPASVQKTEERRLTNLKEAIEWVKTRSNKKLTPTTGQPLSLADVFKLHQLVSRNIDEKHNPPGQLRNNQPSQKTIVGNDSHGGTYRPPKCLDDIEYLLQAWIEWLNHPAIISLPASIRATLAHYYFELIHPFWDGNGRTGRLIEMLILEQSGYRFSSSAIWRHYQENIHSYFALFNECRKAADKKLPDPNQSFVHFSVYGLFDTIENLHDQSNLLIHFLLYQTSLNDARFSKALSERQFNLINIYMLLLSTNKQALSATALYRQPTTQALYHGVTERTYYRDVQKLTALEFINEQDGKLLLGKNEG